MAELDRGEVEAGAEDGALSFSLSSVKLVLKVLNGLFNKYVTLRST
eukprot:SAG11_NODE_1391_length_5051_cov_4.319063_2_plen_46_part_00